MAGVACILNGSVEATIFIAHSYPLLRKGIVSLIEEDPALVLVGEADDANTTVKEICRVRPDIAVVELAAVDDAILVCDVVKTKGIGTRVLFLATETCGEEVYRAIAAGATAYLGRGESLESVLRAIRSAALGEVSISQEAQAALQEYLLEREVLARAQAEVESPRPLLSDVELQVLRHTAKGASIEETARLMYLSASTIKNHRQSLFAKLGVPNAPAAIYEAIRRGILH